MKFVIVFFVLFSIANGLELVSYVVSYESMYPKKEIIVNSSFSLLAILYLAINKQFSTKDFYRLLFFSLFAILFIIADVTSTAGGLDYKNIIIYLAMLYLVIFIGFIKWFGIRIFIMFGNIVGLIAMLVVIKILLNSNDVLSIINPFGYKQITYLSFVNSFAYVCAYALICTFFYYKYKKSGVDNLSKKIINCLSLLTVVFCGTYLLMAKSKGALLVVFAGLFVLIAHRLNILMKILLILIGIMAYIILSILGYQEPIFESLMMYGRSGAENGLNYDKIISMFTNRFGASEFVSDPMIFINQHTFGIGWHEAASKSYSTVENSLTKFGIHSSLILLIEVYGILSIIFYTYILYLVKYKVNLYYLLPSVMILVPMLVTNHLSLVYVIPLSIMHYRQHSKI